MADGSSFNKRYKAGDEVYILYQGYTMPGLLTVYGYTEDHVELIVINEAGEYYFLDPQNVTTG